MHPAISGPTPIRYPHGSRIKALTATEVVHPKLLLEAILNMTCCVVNVKMSVSAGIACAVLRMRAASNIYLAGIGTHGSIVWWSL